jgi:hypothetical protein
LNGIVEVSFGGAAVRGGGAETDRLRVQAPVVPFPVVVN